MNGTPGGSSDWIAPAIALGAAGLAGAGRTGSPASNLGLAILPPILGAYAERGITSEERGRKKALEDYLRQRLERRDVQEQSSALGNLYLQSGLYEPVAEGEPAQIQLDIGGRKVGLRQRERPDINYATRAYTEALGPEFGQVAGAAGFKGSPEEQLRQLAALATAWPAREQRQARERTLGAFDVLARPGYAERPIPAGDMGESWATAGRQPTDVVPPRITPEVAAVLRGAVEGTIPPAAIDNILRSFQKQQTLDEALGRPPAPAATPPGPPSGGIPLPPTAGTPGPRIQRGAAQTPEGGWRGTVTVVEPTQAEIQEQETRQAHKAMATEMLADPRLKAMKLDPATRMMIDKFLPAAARSGSPETLATVWGAILKSAEPQTLERMKAEYFQKYQEDFRRLIQGQVEGKETPADLGRQRDRLMEQLLVAGNYTYTDGVPDLKSRPQRAKIERQLAFVWKRLGEKFPEEYGEESLVNRGIFEHWDKATADKEEAKMIEKLRKLQERR